MANYLLLHGSWHGAWCWHKVIARLESAGHRARAIDLPGRGRAPADARWVSLARMVRHAERALFDGEPTVVVAHSRNGIVASALAERAPDRIACTVYVAAFMLEHGQRVLDVLPDRASWIAPHIRVDRFALTDRLDPVAYRDGLYADCAEDDHQLARALLGPEPIRPALTRLRLTEGRYGRVRRAYVRLAQDRAVSLALQDRCLRASPTPRVDTLDTSHSAYCSQPDRLVRSIVELSLS